MTNFPMYKGIQSLDRGSGRMCVTFRRVLMTRVDNFMDIVHMYTSSQYLK